MKPTAASIIAQLPTLDRAGLSAVKGAADSLLGLHTAPIEQAATPLFKVLTYALGANVGFSAFSQTKAYRQYKQADAAIGQFMAQSWPGLDRRMGQAVMGLMVDCLLADLKARGLPLSMGMVCNNLMRAPQCLRDAFPGYLESGHGQIILDHIKHMNHPAP